MASRVQQSQQLARKFGLKPAEMAKLIDDPERFLDCVLNLIRAKHIDQADEMLTALEKKAKEGDAKSADVWFKIVGRKQMIPERGRPKMTQSKIVNEALRMLPRVTVDAQPIEKDGDDREDGLRQPDNG